MMVFFIILSVISVDVQLSGNLRTNMWIIFIAFVIIIGVVVYSLAKVADRADRDMGLK